MARSASVSSLVIVLLSAIAACVRAPREPAPASGAATGIAATVNEARPMPWRPLFDGRTTTGWRGYRMDSMPAGWQAVEGALTRTGPASDIITVERFRDFELELDWKVAVGGNSGIFYRVTETGDAAYFSGPEMQVLDDARHRDGQSRLTSAGALYGLYPAPAGIVKAAGEWNHARVVVRGSHVEHWLNGVQTVNAEMGSADWNAKVAAGKFREWPQFAQSASGHIALQDHGDWVAFRDIRIRELP